MTIDKDILILFVDSYEIARTLLPKFELFSDFEESIDDFTPTTGSIEARSVEVVSQSLAQTSRNQTKLSSVPISASNVRVLPPIPTLAGHEDTSMVIDESDDYYATNLAPLSSNISVNRREGYSIGAGILDSGYQFNGTGRVFYVRKFKWTEFC